MSFDSAHRSIEGSAPVQLITLTTATESYRYTTWHSFFTYDGNTYAPIAAGRSALKIVPQGESGSLELTLPATDPFVVSQILGTPEPQILLDLVVAEREDGAGLSFGIWKVASGTIEGDDCTIRGASLMDVAWKTEIPSERMRKTCNHILFDEGCDVDPADFDLAATIASINGRVIAVSTVGGNPGQWFRYGKIRRVSDGQERTILDQVGTNLIVSHPFKALAVGNAVTLFAGCDLEPETCRDKFDNVINFSGFGRGTAVFRLANPWTGTVTDLR